VVDCSAGLAGGFGSRPIKFADFRLIQTQRLDFVFFGIENPRRPVSEAHFRKAQTRAEYAVTRAQLRREDETNGEGRASVRLQNCVRMSGVFGRGWRKIRDVRLCEFGEITFQFVFRIAHGNNCSLREAEFGERYILSDAVNAAEKMSSGMFAFNSPMHHSQSQKFLYADYPRERCSRLLNPKFKSFSIRARIFQSSHRIERTMSDISSADFRVLDRPSADARTIRMLAHIGGRARIENAMSSAISIDSFAR